MRLCLTTFVVLLIFNLGIHFKAAAGGRTSEITSASFDDVDLENPPVKQSIPLEEHQQEQLSPSQRVLLKKAFTPAELPTLSTDKFLELKEIREYVQKLVKSNQYFIPPEFGGIITKNAERSPATLLMSSHGTLKAIAKFVERKLKRHFPETYKELEKLKLPEEGCYMSFPVNKQVFIEAFLFEQGASMSEEDIEEAMMSSSSSSSSRREKLPSMEKARRSLSRRKSHDDESGGGRGSPGSIEMSSRYSPPMDSRRSELGERAEHQDEGEGVGYDARADGVGEEEEEDEEEEDEEEGDEDSIPLSTYALIEAIQKGEQAFGKEAMLDWGNLPRVAKKAKVGTLKRAWRLLKKLFRLIIKKIKGGFAHMVNLLTRNNDANVARKNTYKFLADCEQLARRLDKLKIDHSPREKLQHEQVHPFDFLKTIGFNIAVLPAKREFQQTLKTNENEEFVKAIKKEINDKKITAQVDSLHPKLHSEFRSCIRLKELFKTALTKGDDPETRELHGRLGAQILNSVVNAKKATTDIALAMGLSVGVSGGLAYALDERTWPKLIKTFGHAGNEDFQKWMLVLFNSVTPLFAETCDSAIVKRLLISLGGGSLIPSSWKEAKDDLLQSAFAGAIASLGSVANNYLMTLMGFKFFPLLILANQLAATTSAALVPDEMGKIQDSMISGILIQMKQDFYPKPDMNQLVLEYRREQVKWYGIRTLGMGRNPPTSADVEDAALREYAKKKVRLAMRLAKKSSLAINSMGIGGVLSFFFGLLPIQIPVRTHKLHEKWGNIASIMVNTPTESISLYFGTLFSKFIGGRAFQGWWSTERNKNEQMVKLIFEKTVQQMDDKKNEFQQITHDEIYRIYHPKLSLTSPTGQALVDSLNYVVELGYKTFGKSRYENYRKIDVTDLMRPLMAEDKDLVVANWRPDVLYLVQFPRTSDAPSLSPQGLKLETWLKFKERPVYGVSAGIFLSHLYAKKLPFVEFNGKRFDGSTDNIIKELDLEFGLLKENKKELMANTSFGARKDVGDIDEYYREKIDSVVGRYLMYDRYLGFEFMVQNSGVVEQLVPAMREYYPSILNHERTRKWNNWWKTVTLTKEFWTEYFGSENNVVKRGSQFWNGAGIGEDDWDDFLVNLRSTRIPEALRKVFKHSKNVLHHLLNEKYFWYSAEQKRWIDETQTYLKLEPKEIAAKLIIIMKMIAEELRMRKEKVTPGKGESQSQASTSQSQAKDSPFFLVDYKPAPADASLFAHLAQFFCTPLNIQELNEYFDSIKNNQGHSERILYEYFVNIRDKWFGNTWEGMTEKPWSSNPEWSFSSEADKYAGPFSTELIDNENPLDTDDEGKDEEKLQKKYNATFWPLLEETNLLTREVDDQSGQEQISIDGQRFSAHYPDSTNRIVGTLLRLARQKDNEFDIGAGDTEQIGLELAIVRKVSDLMRPAAARSGISGTSRSAALVEDISSSSSSSRIGVAHSLLHLMAAFLCQGTLDGRDCKAIHLEMAKKRLLHILPAHSNFSEHHFNVLNQKVKALCFKMINNFNENYRIPNATKEIAYELLVDLESFPEAKYTSEMKKYMEWMEKGYPPAKKDKFSSSSLEHRPREGDEPLTHAEVPSHLV